MKVYIVTEPDIYMANIYRISRVFSTFEKAEHYKTENEMYEDEMDIEIRELE
jgi:hypothetical protein